MAVALPRRMAPRSQSCRCADPRPAARQTAVQGAAISCALSANRFAGPGSNRNRVASNLQNPTHNSANKIQFWSLKEVSTNGPMAKKA